MKKSKYGTCSGNTCNFLCKDIWLKSKPVIAEFSCCSESILFVHILAVLEEK